MKEKPEIVFVFPPSLYGQYFNHHLGVGYIQAYLQDRGITSIQYVPTKRLNVETLAREIVEYGSKIVGFTCYDSNYYNVRILARAIKKIKADTLIIAGGPTATFSDEFILKDCPEIEVCVRGEGEQTVYELLTVSDIQSIKGLAFRDKGQVMRTPSRPLISGGTYGSELDVLPSPYLKELVPLDGRLGVTTSRGCVYHCIYCNCGVMFGHKVRFHSPGRVIAELEKINEYITSRSSRRRKSYEKHVVNINDDTFSVDIKRAKEICEKIIEKGFSLNLTCETRVDRCDEELLQLMLYAGFKEVNFGLESAVPRVLRNIKKVVATSQVDDLTPEIEFLEKLKRLIKFGKKIGLHVTVSIITGLPGESLQDGIETVKFVEKLKLPDYAHNFLTIYRGTELFESYQKWGLKIHPSPFKLPYETLYAYNVQQVPILPNAMHLPFLRKEEDKFVDLLSGKFGYDQPPFNSYPNVFLTNLPELTETFCHNFSKIIGLSTCIYDMSSGLSHENFLDRRNKLLQHDVPIGQFYYVEEIPLFDEYKCVRLERADPFWRASLKVLMIPFSSYKAVKKFAFQDNIKVLYTLKSSKDVDSFKMLVYNCTSKEAKRIKNFESQCYRLLDQCRWSNFPCPITKFNKIILDGDKLLPCWNAEPIGVVGNSIKNIMAKIKNLYEKEKEKRECWSCEANGRCSKCLYTFPFSVDDYCMLMRTVAKMSHCTIHF
jgi:anaerobic magnesium-protoporphyrin IX monomethyl ester cyclase